MATVRVDIIKDRDGKFHAQTRVNARVDDRMRLGEYLCSFEAEIENPEYPEYPSPEIYQRMAIFLGLLMVRGLDDAQRAVPDLKIVYK